MKRFPAILVLSLLICIKIYAQPFSGTIFVDPDIITSSDPSTLQRAIYSGQADRTVFDRRVNDWVVINAYLFDITWNDGLTTTAVVNPEFGSLEEARPEAEKYGREIGRLPYALRTDVDEIWIHKGVQLFGGGNNSILIHTGQTALYEADGILGETLIHEATHTSLDADYALSSGWKAAQIADNSFISDYAKEFPEREDLAETFLLWFAVRYVPESLSATNYDLILNTIPNRLEFLDDLDLNLAPFVLPGSEGTVLSTALKPEIELYPNPATDYLEVHLPSGATATYELYSPSGKKIISNVMSDHTKINLTAYSPGIYLLDVMMSGNKYHRKIIKE